ncbi:MAG: isochorismatase family protein [Desulfobacterales bacterium]|nr:isochorismatase family protein [Desulfobacterales bacterium]
MITTEDTALVLVDVQGKLAQSMHNKKDLFENLKKMVKGAQVLGVPILWAEQNPDGLGPTMPEIAELFTNQSPVSKFSFSCCGSEQFLRDLEAVNRKNILIVGIEAHVCVYQTAADLTNLQYNVQIVADAVSSRTAENTPIGLEKSKDAGARLTSTETALFELLKEAKGDKFKEIINLVK